MPLKTKQLHEARTRKTSKAFSKDRLRWAKLKKQARIGETFNSISN